MQTRYLDSIKAFEGYTREAKWDYAQFSNGFGTKALYPGERISEAEAERRFEAEIEQARRFVDKHARGWDEGTKAALTSLTFNTGTRWASSGLGEAVRSFDIDALRSRFLAYTKAGGTDLPGLVRRRLAEVVWIGEGRPSSPNSSAPASPDAMPTDAKALNLGASTPEPAAASAQRADNPAIASSGASRSSPPPFAGEQARRFDLTAWLLVLLEQELLRLQVADRARASETPWQIKS